MVIPVYNDVERLKGCLDALTSSPGFGANGIECIVVDNGSDESATSLASRYPNVTFIEEPRPGSYAARNTGAASAAAEYIAFIDSDCIPATDWLESVIEATERCPQVDIFVGGIHLFPEWSGGRAPDRRVVAYEIATAFRQEYYANVVHFGPTANLIVRKSVFDALNGFDETLLSGGDKDFGQRAWAEGYTFRYSPECVVKHPTRSRLSELEGKQRRLVGGEHPSAQGDFGRTAAQLFRYAVLRPGNSLRLIWTSPELSFEDRLLASEAVGRVLGWQVSEKVRLMGGGAARR